MARSMRVDGQPRHGRGVLDGGEALARRLDDAQRGVGMLRGEGLDRHDGVDAAAEGDQGPTGCRARTRTAGAGGASGPSRRRPRRSSPLR